MCVCLGVCVCVCACVCGCGCILIIIIILIVYRDVKDAIVIYDGSFEQELRYHGDQPGILLLMDMWHPGLPADKLPSL